VKDAFIREDPKRERQGGSYDAGDTKGGRYNARSKGQCKGSLAKKDEGWRKCAQEGIRSWERGLSSGWPKRKRNQGANKGASTTKRVGAKTLALKDREDATGGCCHGENSVMASQQGI
jgi:hypothetical protein